MIDTDFVAHITFDALIFGEYRLFWSSKADRLVWAVLDTAAATGTVGIELRVR